MRDQRRKVKVVRKNDAAISSTPQTRPARAAATTTAIDKKPRARAKPNHCTPHDRKQEPGRKKRIAEEARSNAAALEHFRADNETDAQIEDRMGFCCKHCVCSEAKKRYYGGASRDLEFCTDEETAWHRKCCHEVTDDRIDEGYIIEYHKAIEEQLLGISVKKSETSIASFDELKIKFDQSFRQETELANEDSLAAPGDHLLTSERYLEWNKEFDRMIETRKPAVVIDAFGGIGSAIVALKRLGIAIQKIIHVEHDKVANFVYKTNHDYKFVQQLAEKETELENMGEAFWNPPEHANEGRHRYSKEDLQDDGIEHIYYAKFEEVYEMEDFVETHGEIDIIIGSPPCIDFSAVNARRKGIDGPQGKYMKMFGRFIQQIQKMQEKRLFYLAGNVVIQQKEELDQLCEAYQLEWDPIEIDAKDFSPCRRRCHFFTNIPIRLKNDDFRANDVKCDSCLEGDFQTAASIVDKTNDMIVKAQCFMASKGRIDDQRMLVYRALSDSDEYESRSINVRERELMMGFPPTYIEFPVSHLFTLLTRCGYSRAIVSPNSASESDWRNVLPPCCHEFAGNFLDDPLGMPFQFKPWGYPGEEPELFLAHPRTAQTIHHMNKQQYAKRLVGNAFSIPTMELLLRPLQTKFDSRSYRGFDYKYKWEVKDMFARRRDPLEDQFPTSFLPPVHERLKAVLGAHEDSDNRLLHREESLNDNTRAVEVPSHNALGSTSDLEHILGHSQSTASCTSDHVGSSLVATDVSHDVVSPRSQGITLEQPTYLPSCDALARPLGSREIISRYDNGSSPNESCYELQGFMVKPQPTVNSTPNHWDTESSSDECNYDSEVGKAYV